MPSFANNYQNTRVERVAIEREKYGMSGYVDSLSPYSLPAEFLPPWSIVPDYHVPDESMGVRKLIAGMLTLSDGWQFSADGSLTPTNGTVLTGTMFRMRYGGVDKVLFDSSTGTFGFDGSVTIGGIAGSAIIAGKKTFVQPSIPVALNAGDIWYDSDDSFKRYKAAAAGADAVVAGEWELFPEPTGVKVYRQTTVPTTDIKAGDVWFDSDGSDKMYRANVDGATWPTGWTLVSDPTAPVDSSVLGSSSGGANRVVIDAVGVRSWDATATQRVNIANDGSGWLGSSAAFQWTAAGVITVTGIKVRSDSGEFTKLDSDGITIKNDSDTAPSARKKLTFTADGVNYAGEIYNYPYWLWDRSLMVNAYKHLLLSAGNDATGNVWVKDARDSGNRNKVPMCDRATASITTGAATQYGLSLSWENSHSLAPDVVIVSARNNGTHHGSSYLAVGVVSKSASGCVVDWRTVDGSSQSSACYIDAIGVWL